MTNELQQESKISLLIAMDAEWGMRDEVEEHYLLSETTDLKSDKRE